MLTEYKGLINKVNWEAHESGYTEGLQFIQVKVQNQSEVS